MKSQIIFKSTGPVYMENGVEVTKEEWTKDCHGVKDVLKAKRVQTQSTAWPLHSYALGVPPDARFRAEKTSIEKGVPTRFDSEGCAIFESRGHRKKFCQAYGYFDRSGGYSDAMPTTRS